LGLCWWRYEDGNEDDEENERRRWRKLKKIIGGGVQLDIVDMHDLMVVFLKKMV